MKRRPEPKQFGGEDRQPWTAALARWLKPGTRPDETAQAKEQGKEEKPR